MKNKFFVKLVSAVMLLALAMTVAAPVALANEGGNDKVDFVLADDAHYTAIGSSYNVADADRFAALVAQRYNLQDNFTVLDYEGLRISDMRALLDPSYANDAYGQAMFDAMDVDALRAEYVNAIRESDLITVDLGVEDFTSFATNQIIALILGDFGTFLKAANNSLKLFSKFPTATAYEYNWSQFKGETDIEDINEFLKSIDVQMTSSGIKIEDSMALLEQSLRNAGSEDVWLFEYSLPIDGVNIPNNVNINLVDNKSKSKIYVKEGNVKIEIPIPLIEYVQYIVETFMYAFANYAYNYEAVIERIRELNPDATVVVVGKSNFFKNIELGLADVHLNFNDYAADFVYMLNQVAENYAANDDKAIYVPCLDTETIFDATYTDRSMFNIFDFDKANSTVGANKDVFDPSANGHRYIANRIIESLNVLCDHKYATACQPLCDKCSEPRDNAAPHTYDNACDAVCNVCEEAREAGVHVYDDCTDTECNECQATREALEHQYDAACDEKCNLCGKANSAAEHTFGDWVVTKEATATEYGEKTRTCTACGEVEMEYTPMLDAVDEGEKKDEKPEEKSPVAAIVCIVVGVVVVLSILLARAARKKKAATAEEKPEETEETVETETAEEAVETEATEAEAEETTETEESETDAPEEN